MPCLSVLRSGIGGMWSQTHLMMGGGGGLSLVKTDWNCVRKMSSFDLLSLRSVPLNLSGAVPNVILAFRLDVPPERFRVVLGKPFLDGVVYKVPFCLA